MKSRKEKNGLVWYEWYCPHRKAKQMELTGEGILIDQEVAKLKAEFLNDSHYAVLLQEDTDVYAPKEEDIFDMFSNKSKTLHDRLLLSFRKAVFSLEECEKARIALRGAARPSKNRGVAGGKVDPTKISRDPSQIVVVGDGIRYRYITDEGVLSLTTEANKTTGGIAGFFASTTRNPYCRQTAYTKERFELFRTCFPFLKLCSEQFKKLAPIKYKAQEDYLNNKNLIKNSWNLPETVYTTITVNKNFQTACHQDSGDYKAGMENLVVFESGSYSGGYTIFPKFRVAFDARMGDFCAIDVAHHWHGNTEIVGDTDEKFERISLVLYVREDMSTCGTQKEEREKFLQWKGAYRTPTEKSKERLADHLQEKKKDADFMDEFGEE